MIICARLSAQLSDLTATATPNAASLGLYGQITVDYYTGLPNINIPVYEFKSRNNSVPMGLSYHAAGVRPSDHSSWVGLGWSLQAGGLITRIQNDLPDELVDYTYGSPGINRGYFYTYGSETPGTWSSSDTLLSIEGWESYGIANPTASYTHTRRDYAPDQFQFSFLGMNGILSMGQDGTWRLISKEGYNFKVST
ncbi:MAG: hypothetical protein ABUL46_05810, partial [Chitinophaga rupis]